MARVAVIGAGVAGLSAAGVLARAGHAVTLVDKGRGPGGRLSTRRAQTPLGEVAFDHGAQFATARDPAFVACLEALAAAGFAAPWPGRFRERDARGLREARDQTRWVGAPGMNGLVRGLAQALAVDWGVRVTGIEAGGGDLALVLDNGQPGPLVQGVVVAVPAEQAGALVASTAPHLAPLAAAARSSPCWALMAVLEQGIDPGFDALSIDDPSSPLSWIARQASKPGRGEAPAWVAHARPDWSREHLEADADTVAATLAGALAREIGAAPVWQQAHRWRYAQVVASGKALSHWDAQARIGLCGDWCLGPRIEAAWLSGADLARRMLPDLEAP